MSSHYRRRDWGVEVLARRATIRIEMSNGARIDAEIHNAEALLELFEDQTAITSWDLLAPARHETSRRLHLDIEGSMRQCVMTDAPQPRS